MINLAKDINIKSDYLKIIKIEKKFSQNLKKCEICGVEIEKSELEEVV